jgi:hypothetical protein
MPGDGDGETPRDFALLCVPSCFPGTDGVAAPSGVVQSALAALPLSNAACAFCHGEPPGVLGWVGELQTVQPPSSVMRRPCLISGRARRRVEVIEPQTTTRRRRIRPVAPCADACGPVRRGPACRPPNMTPSAQRFAPPPLLAHSFARGCIVLACDPPSTQRPGRVDLAHPWFAGFSPTDDGIASGVGHLVALPHVLQVRHEGSLGVGWTAPRCALPPLEIVFCHAWRLVAREARAP